MRTIQCEQGTAQWLDARRGKITASRIVDVLDYLKKGGEGAGRKNYRIDLIAERLSGFSEEHFVSPEMKWGTYCEPMARTAYEMERNTMVESVGFVMHPESDFTGASPDGLVDEDGALEIKCPKTTTHIKWLMAGDVPEEHQAQCLWVMACTGRKWCDFASYDPRLPDGLKLFIARMHSDKEKIEAIYSEVVRFDSEVDVVCSDLRMRIKVPPAPLVDPRSDLEQLMAMIDAQEMTP